MTLWNKRTEAELDRTLIRFCAGEDQVLDQLLLPYDIAGTKAHVAGLLTIGILDDAEHTTLQVELSTLQKEAESGSFTLSEEDEDSHSAIERVLTQRLNTLGEKVHTGRSRNDQVLVSTRLYARAMLDDLITAHTRLITALLEKAEAHKDDLLAGYTHLQRAVPSTWGFWFAGHAESLLDDKDTLLSARRLLNRSPLGTAAGYGVNLPLARDDAAEALGFDGLIVNGLCAQNGRGKIEAQVLSALLMTLQSIRRASWDLSLFTTSEFGFVRLADRFCTGSSIMPQKRNPDVVEILRATYASVAGHQNALMNLLSLPSGYQRDLQLTKKALVESLVTTADAFSVFGELMTTLEIDSEACVAAFDKGMLATDVATSAARLGVPFREAYRNALSDEKMPESEVQKLSAKSIRERTSLGAPGLLALDRLTKRNG